MIIITRKENIIYEEITDLKLEFIDGIPENIIKGRIDISEHDYHEILNNLQSKNLIIREDGKIKPQDVKDKIKVVENKREVKIEELNQLEKETIKIIKNLTENGLIPRYTLEGNLLYGKLKLDNLQMYRILLSLENKKILKKIKRKDGEYYKLLSP
ncbi:hypothetical protein [Methanothermobacter tenebrarum]|uniref:Uncharacterized protein n=1 Tax=Methanothermobacter tenebrarum TaxID=680118 RepID=A0A328PH46_9EURY|nr:hypothetical protein [Methanothermobacter tenebrarum]MBC7100942.1 hypothetical protein [Methanobacteriales archaeon]NPV64637.1 hypothetical protein [Methanobacteriaceae archaeon]RAO78976.1 hypothetical protein DPC56_04870 [Methanothermobacter tenebrarum]